MNGIHIRYETNSRQTSQDVWADTCILACQSLRPNQAPQSVRCLSHLYDSATSLLPFAQSPNNWLVCAPERASGPHRRQPHHDEVLHLGPAPAFGSGETWLFAPSSVHRAGRRLKPEPCFRFGDGQPPLLGGRKTDSERKTSPS